MSESPNVQTSTAGESSVTPETQTLEQIAKEIPVTEQVKEFTAQPVQQPQISQPQQPYIPDPVTDPDGYKRFVSTQLGQTSELASTLQEIKKGFQEIQNAKQQERIEADVKSAVSKVNGKLKLDDDFVEAALNVEYQKNPTFKFIWDNRHKNPQALDKALGVLSDKYVSKFAVRQDPQIAENVRAAQLSQKSQAVSQQPKDNGVPTDPNEFSRYWSRLVSGG